jgi:hypothetical protein
VTVSADSKSLTSITTEKGPQGQDTSSTTVYERQ